MMTTMLILIMLSRRCRCSDDQYSARTPPHIYSLACSAIIRIGRWWRWWLWCTIAGAKISINLLLLSASWMSCSLAVLTITPRPPPFPCWCWQDAETRRRTNNTDDAHHPDDDIGLVWKEERGCNGASWAGHPQRRRRNVPWEGNWWLPLQIASADINFNHNLTSPPQNLIPRTTFQKNPS